MNFERSEEWLKVMEGHWKRCIRKNRVKLNDEINVDRILLHLQEESVFNDILTENIREHGKYCKGSQTQRFLDSLLQRPFRDFLTFCEKLEEIGQHELVKKYFDEELVWRNLLKCNEVNFYKMTQTSNDVIESLFNKKLLQYSEYKVLKSDADSNKRSKMLLQCLMNLTKPEFDKACQILKTIDGKSFISVFDDEIPLQKNIDKNEEDLDLPLLVQDTPSNDIKLTSYDFYQSNRNQTYNMCKKRRGTCYIFNIEKYHDLEKRDGSSKDVENLQYLFEGLHFSVSLISDPTLENMQNKVKQITSNPNLSDDQAVVIVFLCHGGLDNCNNDVMITKDGKQYKVKELLDQFTGKNCPLLKDKPKLFFIQACRGDMFDEADAAVYFEQTTYKDFFIAYSTQKSFRSFRNPDYGSWYINILCQIFSQHAYNTGLCSLMNMVNGELNKKTSSTNDEASNNKKQVGCYESYFTKKDLFFFPGIAME